MVNTKVVLWQNLIGLRSKKNNELIAELILLGMELSLLEAHPNSEVFCALLLTWLGVPLFKCNAGAVSPRRDLSGLTSGVLLVLLADDPDIDAWTDATTFACSGGTYLRQRDNDSIFNRLLSPNY